MKEQSARIIRSARARGIGRPDDHPAEGYVPEGSRSRDRVRRKASALLRSEPVGARPPRSGPDVERGCTSRLTAQ